MRRLHFFRDYEDGYVLIAVRQFMENGNGLDNEGSYDRYYSPLPNELTVQSVVKSENLAVGNFNTLINFKRDHPREFALNRIYAFSNQRLTWCWHDADAKEAYPDFRFNCRFHHELLWRRHYDQLIAQPTGYTGELCVVALKPGYEIKFLTRGRHPEINHNEEAEDQ